jgi:hypothetical protein
MTRIYYFHPANGSYTGNVSHTGPFPIPDNATLIPPGSVQAKWDAEKGKWQLSPKPGKLGPVTPGRHEGTEPFDLTDERPVVDATPDAGRRLVVEKVKPPTKANRP